MNSKVRTTKFGLNKLEAALYRMV